MNYSEAKKEVTSRFRRALVTGGAGFIGSHLVDELLDLGLEVISIDNFSAGKHENINHNLSNPRFTSVKVDTTDYEELRKYFNGVDIVFNQAASKKNICINNPRLDLQVNGLGTFNVLELSRDYGVKKVVHASTGSVYGEAQVLPQTEEHPIEPVSYYGVSKLAGERYAKVFERLYDLDTTILRYFHVYGPRQESGELGGVVAIFARNILKSERPTIFGDGTQQRSFTYVKDVVRANILVAASDKTKGEVFNCASGINVTINMLCDELLHLLGKEKILTPLYKEWQIGDIKVFQISNRKLLDLGFAFETSFHDGLVETVNYFKSSFGSSKC